jgi:hypothetical protein
MEKNDHPDGRVVTLKEPAIAYGLDVIRIHADHADDGAKEAELNVTHPDARRRALQDLLEVDTGEATAKAGA